MALPVRAGMGVRMTAGARSWDGWDGVGSVGSVGVVGGVGVGENAGTESLKGRHEGVIVVRQGTHLRTCAHAARAVL